MTPATRALNAKRIKHLTDGGHPALNFINTEKKDSKGNYIDSLTSYQSFLGWCFDTNIIDLDTFMELDLEQHCYQKEASMTFSSVITLRKYMGEILHCLMKGLDVNLSVLNCVNDYAVKMRERMRYEMCDDGKIRLVWFNINEELNLPFWEVLYSSVALLTSNNIKNVKKCPICGCLFLDSSRSNNRVWCNIKLCGNQHKNKKYISKLKKAA